MTSAMKQSFFFLLSKLLPNFHCSFLLVSHQFLLQEPGTDEDIIEFVKKYNVTFDMFHKINVNGDSAIPLYKVIRDDFLIAI